MGERAPAAHDDAGVAACVHHWLLGDPVDHRIAARCRRCGASRHYAATIEDAERPRGRELVISRTHPRNATAG